MNVELKSKLQGVLEGLELTNTEVDISTEGVGVVATVVSSSFDGMDEADRQALIWDALESGLTPEERTQVEFVFTDSPSEQAA